VRKAFALVALFCQGCVPLPPATEGAPGRLAQTDAGFTTHSTRHFEVRAYSESAAREAGELAERLLERVARDAGLYSLRTAAPITVFLYRSQEEFSAKTDIPPGAATGASDRSGTLFSFEGAPLRNVLSHELGHRVFDEAVGRADPLWVNEGLAVYEEQEASQDPAAYPMGDRVIPLRDMAGLEAAQRVALVSQQDLRPAGLPRREEPMSAWHRQVGGVVRLMIEKGGSGEFARFLAALRDGRTEDEAIGIAFRGRWKGMADLEARWRTGS